MKFNHKESKFVAKGNQLANLFRQVSMNLG